MYRNLYIVLYIHIFINYCHFTNTIEKEITVPFLTKSSKQSIWYFLFTLFINVSRFIENQIIFVRLIEGTNRNDKSIIRSDRKVHFCRVIISFLCIR